MPSIAKVTAASGGTESTGGGSNSGSGRVSAVQDSSTGGRTSPATPESSLVQVLNIVEKKARNLEKRKGKLDGYRETLAKGKALDKDQQLAVSKYDECITNLDMVKELTAQINKLIQDELKVRKKQSRVEMAEKTKADISKVGYVLKVQRILQMVKQPDSKKVLVALAPELKESGLDELIKFSELLAVSPDLSQGESETSNGSGGGDLVEKQLLSTAEHLINLRDQKMRVVQDLEVSYKCLAESIQTLIQAGALNHTIKSQSETDTKDKEVENKETSAGNQETNKDTDTQPDKTHQPKSSRQRDRQRDRAKDKNNRPSEDKDRSAVNGAPRPQEEDNSEEAKLRLHEQGAPEPAPTYPAVKEQTPPAAPQQQPLAAVPAVPTPTVRAEKQPTPEPSFNFLQESQLDVDNPLMNDPAVVMVQGGRKPDQGFPPPPVFNNVGGHNMDSLSQHLLQQHAAAMAQHHHHQIQQHQQDQGQQQPQHVGGAAPQQHLPAVPQQQIQTNNSQQQNYIQQEQPSRLQERPTPRVAQPGVNYNTTAQQQQQH